MLAQHIDRPPCMVCHSMAHGTAGHVKLEEAYAKWGLGLAPLAPQGEIDLHGTPGAPSPSTNGGVPPDLVRILRCGVSVAGTLGWDGPGLLRAWRRDPEGACTFMLSLDPSEAGLREYLDALCGDPGSVGSAVLDLRRTTRIGGPRTI